MHRSLFQHLIRHVKGVPVIKTNLSKELERHCNEVVNKSTPCSTILSTSIHTSIRLEAEGGKYKNDVKSKSRLEKRENQSETNDEQLQSAAVDAAKSLSGDWTRTVEDLMARLSTHGASDQSENSKEGQSSRTSPLLSSMSLERSFEMKRSRYSSDQDGADAAVEHKRRMRKRLARKSDEHNSLYNQPRLRIFDAKKVIAEAENASSENIDKDSLWHVVSQERLAVAKGGLPRNGFEEMIQWTREGRVYSFPVDNEEDMHEERQYGFHEHVFLNRHLKEFPQEGPLRRFMDLVVTGLSKNPWISVPEKVEHIHWYADYFRQKQTLLESSIGEKAKMKHIE